MNNGTKDIQSIYNLLPKPKQVLISLLSTRLCTSEHIRTGFNYGTIAAASNTLKRLKQSGLLKSESIGQFNGLGNVYSLTNKGSEQALKSIGINPYELSEDNKLISKFQMTGDMRISSTMFPHAVSIVDMYYLLLSKCGYDTFKWYTEAEAELISADQSVKLRSDSAFEHQGTKYIIEQDMDTESKAVVHKKLTSYSQVLYGLTEMPVIFFSVNLKYSLSSIEKGLLLKRLKPLKRELDELKAELDVINAGSGTEADTGTINKEVAMINMVLKEYPSYPHNITSFFKRRLKSLNKHGRTGNINITGIKAEYDKKVREYETKREAVLSNALANKYSIRINEVKGILLNIDDKKDTHESIYQRLLEGLDIYVNMHAKVLEYIERYITTNRKTIEIVSEYFISDINSQMDKRSGTKIRSRNKYRLTHNHNTFTVDKFIELSHGSTASYFLITDISYNNIGAYARLLHLLRNFKQPFTGIDDLFITVIVDSTEQAMEISLEADRYGLAKYVQYINVGTVYDIPPVADKDIEHLNMYSIESGTINYLFS